MGKYYITTAIDYANAPPHIGHALEKVQADVLARFRRHQGDEVFFLTGTDEHGEKIARAAVKSGQKPEEFTDKISETFRDLKQTLNLSFDDFIRTTDKKRHWPGAELMWRKLADSGDIYKKTYSGLYCVGHEAFMTTRDLVDGVCPDHKAKPEHVEEENYFFRLSKYSALIGQKIRSGELAIHPISRQHEILSLIDGQGLEDVSFSRPRSSLDWGIPVPGDASQTIYVWCDALTNYLSAIGFGTNEKYKKWWPADMHVIGKDILRFHTALWPGMLLSAGLELPKSILVHGFLTVNGEKISKSIGNVIAPKDMVSRYGADALRYFLLREISSGEDGDFSEQKLQERYASDLANGLGNFAARVVALAKDGETVSGTADSSVTEQIRLAESGVTDAMNGYRFSEALSAIWALISFGDEYVNEKQPWKKRDENVLCSLANVLDSVAGLIEPFLPEASGNIHSAVVRTGKAFLLNRMPPLFPRL